MKKLLVILLLILLSLVCIGQKDYTGPYQSEPNRLMWAGIGYVSGEVVYQSWYLITKDHKKTFIRSIPTVLLVSFGTAKVEQWCNGWDEIHGCHFAVMSFTEIVNLGVHQYLHEIDKNYTVYQFNIDRKFKRLELKKQARIERKYYKKYPHLAFR